jgi:hypothetical protein
MSMKNSSDTIGNRTRDLPTCSTVPQPTALPRAPLLIVKYNKFFTHKIFLKFTHIYRKQYFIICIYTVNNSVLICTHTHTHTHSLTHTHTHHTPHKHTHPTHIHTHTHTQITTMYTPSMCAHYKPATTLLCAMCFSTNVRGL